MNKSSTKTATEQRQAGIRKDKSLGISEQIDQALICFEGSLDLETSARQHGALLRHRGVGSATDLLRIVLGYSVLDYSLRQLGMWCVLLELVDISKTALLKRLKQSHVWLGYLIARILMQQKVDFPTEIGLQIKLVDATVVCPPGSTGEGMRLHVGFDLKRPGLDWIKITDGKGAENLNRFGFRKGDLCIADRAYALLSNLVAVIAQQAWFIVRIGWFRQPGLRLADGQAMDIIAWLKHSAWKAQGEPFEQTVWLPNQDAAFRLVARAIPEQAAEEVRRRLRKEATKKGRTIDERSLIAAGFVLLLTNLPTPAYPALQILELYRFRWQIELYFKRLKSLTGLDQLRAKDPDLALTYLYGKLLGALFLDHMVGHLRSDYPTWFVSQHQPLSLWRLTNLLWQHICSLIRGSIPPDMIIISLPRLKRFLCDEPRKRKSQFAAALTFLDNLDYA